MPVYAAYPPMVVAAAEFTRPANTTAYAAGDVVSNSASATVPMLFAGVGSQLGGSGVIRRVRVFTDQAAMTAGLKLWLYNDATFTVAADNAAFVNEWDDRGKFVGSVDCATLTAGSEFAYAEASPDLEFVCGAGSADLWGFLTSDGTPTPASGQKYRVELVVER